MDLAERPFSRQVDNSTTCGGPFRLSVYQQDPVVHVSYGFNTTDFTYTGCYNVSKAWTKEQFGGGKNDVESCVEDCRSHGFVYAGAVFGQECWCGFQLPNATKVPDTQCFMHCATSSQEICGAPGLASTYKLTVPGASGSRRGIAAWAGVGGWIGLAVGVFAMAVLARE
ncbi:hypothetical protein HK101_008592 [Irineochytrium annulatum]|nr:hypothetical protein HK101_008592 [Irineochytrium annulatum]